MADEPRLKLELRVGPADSPPDVAVLDDLVRLIRQGVTTAPKAAPQVADGPGFRQPTPDEQRDLRDLTSKVEHRIEQASAASVAAVARRAEVAAQPDGAAKLADESLKAAERVVSAVGRAVLRGVAVRVADATPGPPAGAP